MVKKHSKPTKENKVALFQKLYTYFKYKKFR